MFDNLRKLSSDLPEVNFTAMYLLFFSTVSIVYCYNEQFSSMFFIYSTRTSLIVPVLSEKRGTTWV